MNRSVRATGLTAVTLVATLLAGTGTAVAASHHRATVVVHTTAKHKVVVPGTTRPGTARIKNTGAQAIFLVTPRHGAGRATLAHDLNAEAASGLIKHFVVADTLPGRATTYVHLTRGTYYLADISRNTFTAASTATLHVSGRTVNATVPNARAVVVTSHNTLTSPDRIGTSSELRIRNASIHLQEVLLWPVAKAATDGDLSALLTKPTFARLFRVVASLDPTFLAMLSPNLRATSSQHHRAGRYLLVTFTFTKRSSEAQLTAGGVRLVTVH